jgi:hypothetical protein
MTGDGASVWRRPDIKDRLLVVEGLPYTGKSGSCLKASLSAFDQPSETVR